PTAPASNPGPPASSPPPGPPTGSGTAPIITATPPPPTPPVPAAVAHPTGRLSGRSTRSPADRAVSGPRSRSGSRAAPAAPPVRPTTDRGRPRPVRRSPTAPRAPPGSSRAPRIRGCRRSPQRRRYPSRDAWFFPPGGRVCPADLVIEVATAAHGPEPARSVQATQELAVVAGP